MAARKLQQEIERCFKQVDLGVESFDNQYEKYEQSTNASQRDKLVDSIKKECKKLQRLRDQIKTWAAGSDVKDKGPLQDKRELIERKMEAFKAVEKEMKTKAFSKEGLATNVRLDPKEKDREEMTGFLQDMVDKLERQIESLEAETESLQIQSRKSRKDTGKADRVLELERTTERHKWHQGRLELLMRQLANDGVDPDRVKDSEDDIRNYVDNNQDVDWMEDDGIYDEFGLDEESGIYGVGGDMDRVSSHDLGELEQPTDPLPPTDTAKIKPKIEPQTIGTARRPSQHMKSPLPALASLHTLPPATAATVPVNMKPAPPPTKLPGETLKYASAAAAAAASDTGIGITPLPPPPSKPAPPPTPNPAPSAVPAAQTANSSIAASPAPTTAQPSTATPAAEPASAVQTPALSERPLTAIPARSRIPSQSSMSSFSPAVQPVQPQAREHAPPITSQNGTHDDLPRDNDSGFESEAPTPDKPRAATIQANGLDHRNRTLEEEDESVYHLPASLKELVASYEAVKLSATPPTNPEHQRMFALAYANRPISSDAEKPQHYRPQNAAVFTPSHYPQEPLPIFDDSRLYSKIDTDALFYSFYYRQGSYQQYLAAKALKNQSWRFHKQYQTWFQRHEEPKSITEDYEQGTYRFFDYESTWMNRRKADFKFAYKFLEDDL